MKVWIDTKTGTWGDAKDMVIVDLSVQGDTIEQFDGASDFQIAEYGQMYGERTAE